MTYTPQIEVLDKYICVSHCEPAPPEYTAQDFAERLADLCDQYDRHRVLLDERNRVYSIGNIIDLISLGDKLVRDMLVFRFHRVAAVTSTEQMRIIEDFEAVARNRGLNYRAFPDIQAAEAWLLDG